MSRCVSNKFLGNVIDYLMTQKLITAASLLANTSINVHELSNKDGFIDWQRFTRFVEFDESIHRKKQIASPENGIIEKPTLDVLFDDAPDLAAICCNSFTIRDAINTYFRYKLLKENFVSSVLVESDSHLIVSINTNFSSWYTTRMALYEFTTINAICQFYRKNVNVIEKIVLSHNISSIEIKYISNVFCCPIERSIGNSIYINKKIASEPFDFFNIQLNFYQERNILKQVEKLQPKYIYSIKVTSAIREVLTEQYGKNCSDNSSVQDLVCIKLGVSRWSLLRGLSKEGTSYNEIYASIRIELACKLLKTSNYSIFDISSMLGFSDQSSFSRFFKEKAHLTPKSYRDYY